MEVLNSLHDSAKEFVVEALNILQKDTKGVIPKKKSLEGKILRGKLIQEFKDMPFFADLLYDRGHYIEQLSESKRFVSEILKNQIIKQNFITELRAIGYKENLTQKRLEDMCWGYCAYKFLSIYLDEVKSFKFKQDVFESMYQTFVEYFGDNTMRRKYFVPLYKLRSDVEQICFDNFVVKRIDDREKLELYEKFEDKNSIPGIRSFLHVNCILQTEIKMNKKDQYDNRYIHEMFDNIMITLMLYKKGAFYLGDLYSTADTKWSGVNTTSKNVFPKGTQYGKDYILTKKDANDFPKLWESIKNISEERQQALHIPVNRFYESYLRDTIEDKIIDLMIALESIFLEANIQGELRYRMALKIASLLGNNYPERKRIFKFMINAYDLRSKIVHGGSMPKIKINEKEYSPIDFAFELEDIVRKSLVKLCLDFSGSKNDLIEAINYKILGGH